MPDNSLNDSNLEPGTGVARDLLLGPDGDLAFSAGDLVLVRGTQAIAQEISIRLKFFLGEWFLDILAGVDYLNQVHTKPPDLARAANVLAQEIAKVPGVARVETVSPSFIGTERRMEVSYTVTLESGETLTGEA